MSHNIKGASLLGPGMKLTGLGMKQPGPGMNGSGIELPGHGMDRTGMAMTRQHPLAISHKINRRHNWYRLATNETQEVQCLCTYVLVSVVTQERQGWSFMKEFHASGVTAPC